MITCSALGLFSQELYSIHTKPRLLTFKLVMVKCIVMNRITVVVVVSVILFVFVSLFGSKKTYNRLFQEKILTSIEPVCPANSYDTGLSKDGVNPICRLHSTGCPYGDTIPMDQCINPEPEIGQFQFEEKFVGK